MSDPLSPILVAAERLLSEGPDALTMDRLAQAAGVSRATLYRLVGSREQLLLRLGGGDSTTDVRERILQAARELFSLRGFEGCTVEDIARAAEVGPVTIYRHFGSKEGLFLAFANTVGPRRRAYEALAATTGDLRADLRALCLALLAGLREDQAGMRALLGEACRNGPFVELLRSRSGRGQEALTQLFQRHQEQGALRPGDAALYARSFTGLLLSHAFFFPLLSGGSPPEPELLADHVVSLFLEGAASLPSQH